MVTICIHHPLRIEAASGMVNPYLGRQVIKTFGCCRGGFKKQHRFGTRHYGVMFQLAAYCTVTGTYIINFIKQGVIKIGNKHNADVF